MEERRLVKRTITKMIMKVRGVIFLVSVPDPTDAVGDGLNHS